MSGSNRVAIRVAETEHLHEDNKNGENCSGVLIVPLSPHFPSTAQTFRHFFISSAKAVVTPCLVPASLFIPSDFVITVITHNESLSWSSLS